MEQILIIEDDEAIAMIEKDFLEINGHQVTVVLDGETGMNYATKQSFDLIILDIMIIGTVTFMSAFGIVINGQFSEFGTVYAQTWGLNFIVALPYQLLIVGPISRLLLFQIQQTAAE